MRHGLIISAFLLAGLGLVRSEPQTVINWTDALFENDTTSNGAPISSAYTFELGTFGDSFIPEEAKLPLWRSSWKLLDTTPYNDTTQYFGGEATQNWSAIDNGWHPDASDAPADTAVSFAEGEQVYIWIYNNLDQDATTEWGVFTRTGLGAWKLPDFNEGQPVFNLTFTMFEANASPFGGTPAEQGLGSYTPPSSSFAYQTHGFTPVPEPGTLAVLAFALLGLFMTRRR